MFTVKVHSTWTQKGNIMMKMEEASRPTEIKDYDKLRQMISPAFNVEDDSISIESMYSTGTNLTLNSETD